MKKMSLILCVFLCMTTIVCEAKPYVPPFTNHITGDRIDQNMPESFSVENTAKTLLAWTDFGEDVQGLSAGYSAGGWTVEDSMLQLEKTDSTATAQYVLSYSEDIVCGDYYAFTCKIKEENISGTGLPRSVLSAYGDAGWLAETGNYVGKGEPDENGWYEMFQVLKVPENTTSLKLYAHVGQKTAGTVYYDDFKLYRLALDPLEAILVKPAYKGLLYGDGIADISLDVKIKETIGLYDLENMVLSVEFVDSADTVLYSSNTRQPKPEMNVTFSSQGLSEGTYYLKVQLTDEVSGQMISKKERTLRKVSESYRPAFYVDESGHAIRNGEKFFFKRIYDSQSDYTTLAENVVNTQIDTVAHNGMWWSISGREDIASALSSLKENNKTMSLSLIGYWWGNRELDVNMSKYFFSQQRDIRALFNEIVADYKEDDVLEGYYLFDEPDPFLYGEEIRWNHDILSDLDLDHPTYGITDHAFDVYGLFTKMTDIVGIDPYPVSGKETDDIAIVGRSVREMTKSFPNRPVYLCLQGFNWRSFYGEDSRGPNYAELRNMAYQAICEGADGLDCYSYHEMLNDPSGKTFEEWWGELTAVYADVEKYESIILSDEPAPVYTISGGGDWLNITTRRYNGKSYVFAVNNTQSEQSACVKLSGAQSAVTDSGESLVCDANGYSLSFAPLEVKILTVTQNAYASPEAELKSLGFFNCSKSFPVEKGDVNVLQITDDSVIINYHAALSDGAKLYINGVEKALSGKISIKHADNFTVSVVSEDGKTKTNVQYVIDRQQ